MMLNVLRGMMLLLARNGVGFLPAAVFWQKTDGHLEGTPCDP